MASSPVRSRAPFGRVSWLVLCGVVMAMLTGLALLTRVSPVRTIAFRSWLHRAATPVRAARLSPFRTPRAPARAPARVRTPSPLQRGSPGIVFARAPGSALAERVPLTRPATGATAGTPPAPTAFSHQRADAPIALSTPTAGAPDFVVLTLGDEELAPLPTLTGAREPMVALADVADLLGLVVTPDAHHIRVETRAARTTSAVADLASRTVTQRSGDDVRTHPLAHDALVLRDGQWFTTVATLSALTGLELSYDTRSRSVMVHSPRAMVPRFAAAARRQERGSREAYRPNITSASRPGPHARVVRSTSLPTSAALTYAVSHDNSTGAITAQGTLGAAVLGGGLSILGVTGTRTPRSAPDITWLGGNPLNRWLSQVRLGMGTATGLAALPGNGISLTNAPFARPLDLGAVALGGTATPGADIEIQSGGRVLGVVTADATGRWQAPVPVGFGQNLLDVIAYGTRGITRQQALLSFDSDHLPAGRLEYGITAQRSRIAGASCTLLPCGNLGNVDLRWGVTPRLTLRGGASTLLAERGSASPTRTSAYASAIAAPTNWLQLRHEQAGLRWRRSRVTLQPSLGVRAEVAHEAIDGGAHDVPFWQLARAAQLQRESWASLLWRPLAHDLGRLWFSGTARRSDGPRGQLQQLTTLTGARVHGTLLTVGIDHVGIAPAAAGMRVDRTRVNALATVPQLRTGPAWLRSGFATVGTSTLLERGARPDLSVNLTTTLRQTLLMQVGSEWRPGTLPSLRLQFQHHARSALVMQSASAAAVGRSPVLGSTTLLGSALVTVDGRRPQFTSDLVAMRARVRVFAFLDANNNGRRDPDETPVSDVPVLVGTRRLNTDLQGELRVDGLQVLDAIPVRPDVPHVIGADGRLWVLGGPAPWVRLVPFAETPVWLAYIPGTLVTARVPAFALSDAIRVAPLDDPDAAPSFARAFADGTAAIGAVRPGRYRVSSVRLLVDGTTSVSTQCDLVVDGRAPELRVALGPAVNDSRNVPACLADAVEAR